jgi:signal transduction histidine kinase
MAAERSLRRRFNATLMAFGVGVAFVIGLLGHMVNERIEAHVWRSLLEIEMQVYADHLRQGLERRPDAGKGMHAYATGADGRPPEGLPAELAALDPGLHDEIAVGDRWYSVMVRSVDGRRLYVVVDITSFERTEERLVLLTLAFIALMVLLLYLASRLLSRAMVRPVLGLADDVAKLDPGERGARLAGQYTDAELATIARAIDTYLERLDAFVQREHQFISAVSHELRTPMAVIAGSAELLREKDSGAGALPIERIEQGVRNLDETLATLLYLATEPTPPPGSSEPCRLDELVPEIVRDHAHLLAGKALKVELVKLEPTPLRAPDRIVYIAVGNLLRNAIQHSFAGRIDIALDNGVFSISDQGPGMSAEEISRAYSAHARSGGSGRDGGLGLYIIRRICARFGWRIEFESEPGRGTTVRLDLHGSLVPNPAPVSG